MSLYEINNQLLRGKSLSDEKFSTEVLETLINIFQEAANFNEKVIDKIFYEWYEIQLKYYSNKLPEIIKINTSFV